MEKSVNCAFDVRFRIDRFSKPQGCYSVPTHTTTRVLSFIIIIINNNDSPTDDDLVLFVFICIRNTWLIISCYNVILNKLYIIE